MKYIRMSFLISILTFAFSACTLSQGLSALKEKKYYIKVISDSTEVYNFPADIVYEFQFHGKSPKGMSIRLIGKNYMGEVCSVKEPSEKIDCYRKARISIDTKTNTLTFFANPDKYHVLFAPLKDNQSIALYNFIKYKSIIEFNGNTLLVKTKEGKGPVLTLIEM